MDILAQTKLTKSEWESIEIPVPENEISILKMIHSGYSNVNTIQNNTKTMISFTKLQPSPEIHFYLYNKYFRPVLDTYIEKSKESWKEFANFKVSEKTLKKMKSADSIRMQNVDQLIQNNSECIFEYNVSEVCKNVLKSIIKNVPFTKELYTLIEWKKATLANTNPYVTDIMNITINYGKSKTSINTMITNAYDVIERNGNLYKYENLTLFSHQKELFTMCATHQETPKLILYTAPTGTGKTLSPIGLSNGYKILFVCVARHVGLALAKSAISIEKKVAFAFGCDSTSDIRLHYFSAIDYEVNKRSGGIWRVDHSNGNNVEIMICDVYSYLHAMRYMCAFNERNTMLTYWDEPTMTLDYEVHPLHDIIKQNWSENVIPNLVLSCATLPKEEEIHECIMDYCTYFPNAIVHTITSFDCRKSIPILNSSGFSFMPHIHSETIDQLQEYSNYCIRNKTLLRYFDLEEIVKFLLYVHEHGLIDKNYEMDQYFDSISDVTMNTLKLYYLEVLRRMNEESWKNCRTYLSLQQKKKYAISNNLNGGKLQRIQSVQNTSNVLNETIRRNNSDSQVDEQRQRQIQEALTGVLLTTKDSHTLTDGPTIYLADNIMNMANFYVKQSKIPDIVLNNLMEGIRKNESLFGSIREIEEQLEKMLQVKDNTDKTDHKDIGSVKKQKTAPREKQGLTEGAQLLKDNIENLRSQLFHVSLNPSYMPNKKEHQELWTPDKRCRENAFTSSLEESTVKEIMELEIPTNYKVLVLMGVGVLIKQEDKRYEEIVKRLAEEQKLFLILTSSDYIYGTNYQFCHGFIGKDLQNMTSQKILQAMGRIGRNKHQQDYTVRFRDDNMIRRLFKQPEINREAYNMNTLFTHD